MTRKAWRNVSAGAAAVAVVYLALPVALDKTAGAAPAVVPGCRSCLSSCVYGTPRPVPGGAATIRRRCGL